MHHQIRDSLESYLAGVEVPAGFKAHLDVCAECAAEVRAVDDQARLFAALRSKAEPRAGFYGRVMARIDEQIRPSIWSVFLQPAFATRLMLASAALVLALGTYLVSTEPHSAAAGDSASIAPTIHVDDNGVPDSGERDAVLVNLVAYRQ